MTPRDPLPSYVPAAKFTLEDANKANDKWGANCGPGAIAAIMGMTLDELRPKLHDFEQKCYTNPTLMWKILDGLGAKYNKAVLSSGTDAWSYPVFGLVRVQWEGPWTEPGVPIAARYRQTHWIAACREKYGAYPYIFDINAICVGGWIPRNEWEDQLAPWLIKECVPRANGKWHFTHIVEIKR